MSHVNFLEKLLGGEGVEWVRLGSVSKIGTGSSNRQDESESGTYPFYVRSKNILRSDTFEFDEEAIIIPGEGGIGDIFHYVNGKYALHQRAYRISITSKFLNTKFLYHLMRSCFKQYILMKSVGATSISIRKPMLEDFPVPIPCPENPQKSLEIQAEIVHILDAMTAHTAELTAELTARKKQYNYYRDKLLSFEDGEVEWKSLGDMAFICDGTHQTPTYTQEGVPFVSVENIKNISASKKRISFEDFEKYKYKPQKNDLLMTRIGDIGSCAIVDNDNPLAYYVTLALIRLNQEVMLPKYLKYVIESHIGVRELRKRTLVNASPIKINLGEIGKIILPVPSTKEQARIVTILDKFDALTASITEGLPREIELRQKQYASYRDLLLSFPQAQAA